MASAVALSYILTYELENYLNELNKNHTIISCCLGNIYHVPTVYPDEEKYGQPKILDEIYKIEDFKSIDSPCKIGFTAGSRIIINRNQSKQILQYIIQGFLHKYKKLGINLNNPTCGTKRLIDFERDKNGVIKVQEVGDYAHYELNIIGNAINCVIEAKNND